jgi:hypothetical protein
MVREYSAVVAKLKTRQNAATAADTITKYLRPQVEGILGVNFCARNYPPAGFNIAVLSDILDRLDSIAADLRQISERS